jgi:HK97 gp10 family phage protein
MQTRSQFYGFGDFKELMKEISDDMGVAKSQNNILIPAARNAMKIVLAAAKENLKPGHGYDTGQLQRTLVVGARATKKKDWKSRYVTSDDIVIATVSAKIKKKFVGGVNVGDASDGRAIFTEYGTKNPNTSIKKPKGISKRGYLELQREFGTVRQAPRPYLRPALENNKEAVVQKLGTEIAKILQKYRSKTQTGK